MNEIQRQDVVSYRKLQGLPLHSPPHFEDGIKTYLLTAAIYEHKHIMASANRRMDFQEKLVIRLSDAENFNLYAWAVLPNHYHILVKADLNKIKNVIARLHNGIATQWNCEDNCAGRKAWHRFSDRHIRNDDHYWASVNYIHKNPVKHGYASDLSEWPAGSFNIFQETIGKDRMSLILQNYPVDDMGAVWDD
jgi:putative transposase